MKPNIHPEYVESQIVCACGAVYHTRSTKQNLRLGICAACHPFFTGQQKFVDTAGRVEKFTKRFGTSKMTEARLAGGWKARRHRREEKIASFTGRRQPLTRLLRPFCFHITSHL